MSPNMRHVSDLPTPLNSMGSNIMSSRNSSSNECSDYPTAEKSVDERVGIEDEEDNDEMRQKKEAALTMTSFRERAM
ncbi:hypothetical protein BGZ65_007676, partial [Modicella reniformis]